MYQFLPFYQALFNSVVPPDDHTKFRSRGNFPDGDFKIAENQPIGDVFGWGRYLVYHTVGSEWFDPKDGLPVALCVPVITAPASVDGGKSATASAAAPPGAASYRWTITNGIITSADDQQSVTFTAGSSGAVELKLTTFGVCTGTTHNSRTVSIPIIGCDATLSQTSIAAPGDGANYTLAVTLSRQDCPWTAVSHDDWIFVYTGASGVGNGFVGISVGPNPGANRTGSLTIAGVTVTVTQHALCTYSVAPICFTFSDGGGNGVINLHASDTDCPWIATPFDGWARLTGATQGAGDGAIPFVVDANLNTKPRASEIVVQGKTVQILQDGTLAPARPIIRKQPVANQTIVWGQNIFINVDYTGINVRQDWFKNGLGWVSGGEFGQAAVRRDLGDYPPNQNGTLTLQLFLSNCDGGDASDLATS